MALITEQQGANESPLLNQALSKGRASLGESEPWVCVWGGHAACHHPHGAGPGHSLPVSATQVQAFL